MGWALLPCLVSEPQDSSSVSRDFPAVQCVCGGGGGGDGVGASRRAAVLVREAGGGGGPPRVALYSAGVLQGGLGTG